MIRKSYMPKREKRGNSKVSISSLARSITLLRSEVKLGHQELHTQLNGLRDEMRTGFDQICRHIDGFVKLHETRNEGIEGADEATGGES